MHAKTRERIASSMHLCVHACLHACMLVHADARVHTEAHPRRQANRACLVVFPLQIAGRAGASLAVQCDVTSERDVRNLANTVYAKFESVDVVVSSAGIISRGRLLDTPFAEAKRLMDVNYIGAYLLAQSQGHTRGAGDDDALRRAMRRLLGEHPACSGQCGRPLLSVVSEEYLAIEGRGWYKGRRVVHLTSQACISHAC
eukprot:157692-Chlamydomonas_euryale.AAC.2